MPFLDYQPPPPPPPPPPPRDLAAAVQAASLHRKKRMSRHRRRSSSNLHFSFPSSSAALLPPPPRVIDPRRLKFLFEKELKNSDVSSLRRMILPKKAAETHLPALDSKEGIIITMDDLDGLHVWSFKYRFWPNNNSRMYVLENTVITGDFVNAHGLQLGDFIMVYQDYENLNYVIQAKKASDQEMYTGIGTNVVINGDIVFHDYDPNKVGNSIYVPSPTMDVSSFIYDTSSAFDNDSTFDFMSGSVTNYSRMGGLEGFGSVENLSLDEFY
ncbi:B3 domain-containing transcription factor FUS3-like isoform X1 [Cucurbita moschata]|uniref:B3 domain-containing transcription factor FUS3-like isoform X1 n=1 Tax=Cucurbita moschata TaxID=3662 RepID=A0A6J1FG64_CUCMO|nr:B3 domain-containing transcription factor FUS3-like isoform X1 [Cucurbita moschata]